MHEELKNIISQSINTRFELEQKLIQQSWEDESFKQELLTNPKTVFARELGQQLPKDIEIEVLQETDNKVYLVLPTNPISDIKSEVELTEEALESVAGGVNLFGGLVKRWNWIIRNANNLA
ncbi:NHLP leader peptide family RiPP precursor [Halotia branconii]|uniref:NHLP leader peptide family RiPP n=1 Tax=Halotia branconii CENA392 TaxID=1539056 RepID=A0AAJ6NU05_9CYAN|nr:NHLP leader peptide family RiPP precursor [Halotia branconii]WGV26496.1 NHLP leader peptide family RiPP precursor [Halotia branconii CENA392]